MTKIKDIKDFTDKQYEARARNEQVRNLRMLYSWAGRLLPGDAQALKDSVDRALVYIDAEPEGWRKEKLQEFWDKGDHESATNLLTGSPKRRRLLVKAEIEQYMQDKKVVPNAD